MEALKGLQTSRFRDKPYDSDFLFLTYNFFPASYLSPILTSIVLVSSQKLDERSWAEGRRLKVLVGLQYIFLLTVRLRFECKNREVGSQTLEVKSWQLDLS